MNIKIIGKAQIIFQADKKNDYGKDQEFRLELELPAATMPAHRYSVAITQTLLAWEKTLKGIEWPT